MKRDVRDGAAAPRGARRGGAWLQSHISGVAVSGAASCSALRETEHGTNQNKIQRVTRTEGGGCPRLTRKDRVWGQLSVNLGSTWGRRGVNVGSTRGQPAVNPGSTSGQPGVNLVAFELKR